MSTLKITGSAAAYLPPDERRRLSKALLPHVKEFYAGYFDLEQHQPFYRPSSRV